MLRDSRVQRVAAWLLLAILIMALQDFYGVIAGTFILSFVGNSIISFMEARCAVLHRWCEDRLQCKLPTVPRNALSALYIIVVLYVLALGTVFTVPQVISSWRYLKQVLLSDNPYVELAGSIHAMIGSDATGSLETFFAGILGDTGSAAALPAAAVAAKTRAAQEAATQGVYASPVLSDQLQRLLRGYVNTALPIINRLLKSSSKLVYHTLLSLLFSFVLVFEKNVVAAGVRRLVGPVSPSSPPPPPPPPLSEAPRDRARCSHSTPHDSVRMNNILSAPGARTWSVL
jgi:predicted PurR-regulated permease PerM